MSKSPLEELDPEIVRRFWIYHRENPHILDLVAKFTKQVRAAGFIHYSIIAIFERVRWHIEVETRGDPFKLNNSYRSCYSRVVMMRYPELKDFFETRVSPGRK